MKTKSWKVPLIIIAIIISVVGAFTFGFWRVENKAISYENQITAAESQIKVQEKRRTDLIPNLVDCVKAYDKHEYNTLTSIINSRVMSDDTKAEKITTQIKAVAEAYPDLQSSSNYKELMNELATTENKIANVRINYNTWVTKYDIYVKQSPNKQILKLMGYEKENYQKLDFEVSEDAPTNLFN